MTTITGRVLLAVALGTALPPAIAVAARSCHDGTWSMQANGIGRLSCDAGTGIWRGRSRTQQCSCRWEAERRG
jgi:hypothetical protein